MGCDLAVSAVVVQCSVVVAMHQARKQQLTHSVGNSSPTRHSQFYTWSNDKDWVNAELLDLLEDSKL
jgi:hypothetical protein